MNISDNEYAKVYDAMQKSIDWSTASDELQINVMKNMLHYLKQIEGTTPIFTFGYNSNRLAVDLIDRIENRIRRFEKAGI